jgi:hypothetical protein
MSDITGPVIGAPYAAGFASIGKSISLAKDWDAKKIAWRNGVREALTKWNGIERTDVVSGCHDIAEAKDLIEHFGQDEIQRILSDEVLRAAEVQLADAKPINGGAVDWEAVAPERGNDRTEYATELFDPWQRYAVPAFPLEILPPPIKHFVQTQSEIIGCDRSGLAMAALAALSGRAGSPLRAEDHAPWIMVVESTALGASRWRSVRKEDANHKRGDRRPGSSSIRDVGAVQGRPARIHRRRR